jgi:hypothetical protein
LGGVDAEHLEFAVNPRCTPAILARHRTDELSDLRCNGGPATATAARFPRSVDPKALAVPAHQRVWLDDHQCLKTVWSKAIEPNPEEPFVPAKPEPLAW